MVREVGDFDEFMPRGGEQGEGFRPFFDGSGFPSSRSGIDGPAGERFNEEDHEGGPLARFA